MLHIYAYGEDAPHPNMCMLCEQRPNTADEGLIDTGINYLPVQHSMLAGRRMMCTPCARNMGKAAGMMEAEYVRLLQQRDELEEARREYAARVEALESGHIEAFQQLVEKHVAGQPPGPTRPGSGRPGVTGSELALAVFAIATVVASNLAVLWFCLRWTQQRETTTGPLLADALDRLQESIGTIHSYQVAVNAEKLPSAGRPADLLPVQAPLGDVRIPAEAMRPDGTVDQDVLQAWMDENQATEIELPIDLEGAHE
jgi:hypothetical protein